MSYYQYRISIIAVVIASLILCFTTGCSSEEDSVDESTDSNDPGDPSGTSLDPSPAFPGQISDWCKGQPENFSFFVTSMSAIWQLSGSVPDDWEGGFGGDFQGIEGADSICQLIADATDNGHKRWRAFLSATDDGAGNPIHAIERIGQGPWHDANGRLIANNLDGLMRTRPDGDEQAVDDLADECGVPLSALGDSHDVITGSDPQGRLRSTNPESTCNDWTTSDGSVGATAEGQSRATSPIDVFCGHSFPRATDNPDDENKNGQDWLSDHKVPGCGKGANLEQGRSEGNCIGCSGGYGAIYCFAEAQN
ncbi:MAG: hypothetical protein HOI23_12385 [Deltaproteobacteria bacterium]|nr:hypothetical protein [Deltaproteobacteria bacterium]MBT6433414.1 hypothetical protein [Deltaproteobacteria bacterium]MBT6492370.1 hypothetical protein [Deltaproteobacteria bacterium]